MAVRKIPEGQDTAIPYLCVNGGAAAIDFYKRGLGATEVYRLAQPDGKIGHAELKIGGGPVFLADEYPEMGFVSPKSLGGTPVMIHLYVEDVDALAKQLTDAGAKTLRPVETQFYGDRGGAFEDPFGHRWWVATHVEDVSPEEMDRRAKAAHGSQS
jgi:PhnB protein